MTGIPAARTSSAPQGEVVNVAGVCVTSDRHRQKNGRDKKVLSSDGSSGEEEEPSPDTRSLAPPPWSPPSCPGFPRPAATPVPGRPGGRPPSLGTLRNLAESQNIFFSGGKQRQSGSVTLTRLGRADSERFFMWPVCLIVCDSIKLLPSWVWTADESVFVETINKMDLLKKILLFCDSN